jgi:hypothetical protein
VAQIGAASLERGDVAGRGLAGYEGARRQAFGWKQAVTVLVQLFVQYPALMDYALPRLSERPAAGQTLSNVLGDLIDARRFLNAHMLWAALRP